MRLYILLLTTTGSIQVYRIHNVKEHIDALFGEKRAENLRRLLAPAMSPSDREHTIVNFLTEALQEMGGKFVQSFRSKTQQERGPAII